MFKIPLEELIGEVRLEIEGYEDISEEKVLEWEAKFRERLETEEGKIKEIKGKKYVSLKDESEIFAFADNYLAAIDAGEEENYWAGI